MIPGACGAKLRAPGGHEGEVTVAERSPVLVRDWRTCSRPPRPLLPPPVSREPGFVLPPASRPVRRRPRRSPACAAVPARTRRGRARRDLRRPQGAAAACGHRPAPAAPPQRALAARGRERAPTRCTRSIPTGTVLVDSARPRAARRPLRRLGPAARPPGGCSRSRAACGSSATGASGTAIRAGAAATARLRRARDRRLRAAARALPLPGGPVRLSARPLCVVLALAAAGMRRRRRLARRCRRLRRRASTRSTGAARRRSRGPARRRSASPCARLTARSSRSFRTGAGPAHGRAPDHRARRPLDDHPPAPADPRERAARAPGTAPARGPLPRAGRRLPAGAADRATSSSRTTCRSASGDVKAPLPGLRARGARPAA